MNKYKNDFNSFLQERHMEDYHGTDDDSVDAFEAWLAELQTDDLITYADEWGRWLIKNMKERVQQITVPKIEYDGYTWDMIIEPILKTI